MQIFGIETQLSRTSSSPEQSREDHKGPWSSDAICKGCNLKIAAVAPFTTEVNQGN
jgi:hypothetical protein